MMCHWRIFVLIHLLCSFKRTTNWEWPTSIYSTPYINPWVTLGLRALPECSVCASIAIYDPNNNQLQVAVENSLLSPWNLLARDAGIENSSRPRSLWASFERNGRSQCDGCGSLLFSPAPGIQRQRLCGTWKFRGGVRAFRVNFN